MHHTTDKTARAPAWRIFVSWLPIALIWPLLALYFFGDKPGVFIAMLFALVVAVVSPTVHLLCRRHLPQFVHPHVGLAAAFLAPWILLFGLNVLGALNFR